MTRSSNQTTAGRRQFLRQGGLLAASATALDRLAPRIFAGEDNTIRLALIGCGGRGNGAVVDALSVTDCGPVKLYAMADLEASRMSQSHDVLKKKLGDRIDVAEDRKFVGFDAYKKAIGTLRPGDIAMCTTRAYIRPIHVEYAVQQGINVFMEKPFAADPGGLHRLLRAGEEAEKRMEYTFADGTKAFCGFRRIRGTRSDFATYIHGTKCAAQFSGQTHAATVHRFKDQRISKDNIAWTPAADKFSPWQYEWNDFLASIRQDRPHNECRRAVYSDLTTLMGRAACHTGQAVTWDEMMKSRFQFCEYLDRLDDSSPAPVKADENGCFPVPVPGSWKEV